MKIIKRDGRVVDFNAEKIVNAMTKARTDVYKLTDDFVSFTNTVAKDILDETKEDKMTVEEVQDYVEDRLLHSKYKETARDYIRYRQKRTDARKSTIDDVVNEIVEDRNDYWSNENSNKNSALATTQRDYIAGAVSTDQSMRNLLPKDVVEAHKAGIIHFHDIDYFIERINNCGLVNLEDMLQNGTVISDVLIEKPHRFSTACNIATQVIAQVASSQYGF